MTIAVAVQTSSAIVFAADSKLTTRGRAGYDPNGDPILVNQTYDNAEKIVTDGSSSIVAMVAGSTTLGATTVTDHSASSQLKLRGTADEIEKGIQGYARVVGDLRADYWKGVPSEDWPDAGILLAAVDSGQRPLLWHIEYTHAEPPAIEQVKNAVYFEGSYRSVFTLLYAYDPTVLYAAAKEVKIGDQALDPKILADAVGKSLSVLKPIEKLNTWVMPVQDAIDFAYFLASTQIQMERFLPGEALCGGPIDVVVLKAAPVREILRLPGKQLRHPGAR